MSVSRISSRSRRLNKAQKLSVAGVSTLAAAALAFSLVPDDASATTEPQAAAAAAPVAYTGKQTKNVQASVIEKNSTAEQLVKAADEAKAKDAAAKKKAAAKAAAKAKAVAAEEGRGQGRREEASAKKASRAADRKPVYTNNLDGWIRESLSIMDEEGHPRHVRGPAPQHHPRVQRQPAGHQQLGHQRDQRRPVEGPAAGHQADLRRLPRQGHHARPVRPGRQHHRRVPTTRPTSTARSTTSTARTEPRTEQGLARATRRSAASRDRPAHAEGRHPDGVPPSACPASGARPGGVTCA